MYTYDTAGNRTSKKTYAYTTSTLGTATATQTLTYSTGEWGDQRTGTTYDAVGNPLTYNMYTMTWRGRQLVCSFYSSSVALIVHSYTYNDEGIRTSMGIGVEDSINGVKSIHAAGMRAVMIPDMIPPTDEVRSLWWRECENLLELLQILQNHH